jgi:hypothetical protein
VPAVLTPTATRSLAVLTAGGAEAADERLRSTVAALLSGAASPMVELRCKVSRPFSSWNWPILTEIYLCHACSCQEILRVETARQVGRTALWLAAAHGRAAAVAALADGGADLEAADLSGGQLTPLLIACQRGAPRHRNGHGTLQ